VKYARFVFFVGIIALMPCHANKSLSLKFFSLESAKAVTWLCQALKTVSFSKEFQYREHNQVRRTIYLSGAVKHSERWVGTVKLSVILVPFSLGKW
jgi:hypothetical protein